MPQRIVLIDDENLDEDGNFIPEDVTDEVQELVDENAEYAEFLEQVEASFAQAQEDEVALSLARKGSGKGAPIIGKGAPATVGATGSTGRVAGGLNTTTSRIAPKASKNVNSATASGVGKLAGARAKGASVAKHLKHAAKLIGRFAMKNKVAAATGAAAGAVTGGIVGTSLRKMQHGHSLSQDELSLENEFDSDEDYSDEDLESMTPDDAVALIEEGIENGEIDEDDLQYLDDLAENEAESTKREELKEFIQNFNPMVDDAVTRSPKAK